jgi:hypothetical protein
MADLQRKVLRDALDMLTQNVSPARFNGRLSEYGEFHEASRVRKN